MSKWCLLFLFNICAVLTSTVSDTLKRQLENPAVVKFREYLRIDNSRIENLQIAVEFWKRQAEEFGLEFSVYEPAGEPICVLTWPGANSSLPSIMLNSHVDVVPAVPEDWTYPPYAAEVDEDGNIYGRGAQDTKDVAIQYLEAVGRIMRENITLQRTVHLTLMPDEETGGYKGMRAFLKTPEFRALNVGFALDEGVASRNDVLYAMYQDRLPWHMKFTVEGNGGHGSSNPDNLAIDKLHTLLNVMMEYRKEHLEAIKSKSHIELGPFTTLNINMLNGGTAANTIPQRFSLVADLRLSPRENLTEVSEMVNSWLELAGPNTKVEFLRQEKESPATPVDETNPYFVAMNETIHQLGHKLRAIICPGTTDMMFLRTTGVPAINFAPRFRTDKRAHDFDEYVRVDVFLQGIEIYVELIKKLANLPG